MIFIRLQGLYFEPTNRYLVYPDHFLGYVLSFVHLLHSSSSMHMKILPLGQQNFEDIIQRNLLYVDKTKQVYKLIQQGDLYFLSQPQRFGKSLLLGKTGW